MKRFLILYSFIVCTTISYSQNYVGGHEYVDLGLPSGDCWATCYVGASTPEEYGGLYAWGETETKDVYTDETYLYTPIYVEGKDSIDPEGYTHHTDGYYVYAGLGKDIAGTQYDVANVKWGHGWKMPTCEQAKELILNCTFEYVEKNGVKGFKVTGPNKKSIFFTAGPNGYGDNIQFGDVNSFNCWTSTFNPNEKMWGRDWKGSSYHFWANYINDKSYNSTYYPSAGFTIRPVITKEAIEDYKMNTFIIIYIVDEEFYKSFEIKAGEAIPLEPAPIMEGYTFSGWSEIPETMPAHDVTVTGTFSINKYKLTYTIDGEEYKTYEVEYGTTITPEAEPSKEGYSFSSWSDIPQTMPANDVTVTGTFTKGTYKLIYIVDGETYKTISYDYSATITPETAPTKEGYAFSGWNEIPETMPAHDVTVTGTFGINNYKLTYTIDGEEYKSYEMEYGATITQEAEPSKEGCTFSGWSEIPETMPAHNVIVIGTFNINKYKLIYLVDGEEYKNYEVEYGTSIIPEAEPSKEGYTFSGWSEIPEMMPAKDVTITGTFTINTYKLTYMIDNEVYKVVEYNYGAAITPEPQPDGDYVMFVWKDVPETMPSNDVTVYADYQTGISDVLLARGIKYIYAPNGKRIEKLQKGLNIVVMNDGTVRKVVIK